MVFNAGSNYDSRYSTQLGGNASGDLFGGGGGTGLPKLALPNFQSDLTTLGGLGQLGSLGNIGGQLGGSQNIGSFQLGSGTPNSLNNNNNNNYKPNLMQFLLGSDKQGGLLPGLGSITKDLGSLYLGNQQLQRGLSQDAEQKQIFNNRQDRLKEESIRKATNFLDATPTTAGFTDQERQAYIDQRTVQPKHI